MHRTLLPIENQDVKTYSVKKRTKRIIGLIIWNIVWAIGIFSYYKSNPLHISLLRLIIVSALIFVAGLILFRIDRIIFEHSFPGVILSFDTKQTYGTSNNEGNAGERDFIKKIVLTVILDDGRRKKIRFQQKDGLYMIYTEGTRINKYAFADYPEALTDDNDDRAVCVVCGFIGKKSRGRCEICDHSLVIH